LCEHCWLLPDRSTDLAAAFAFHQAEVTNVSFRGVILEKPSDLIFSSHHLLWCRIENKIARALKHFPG